MTVTNNLKGMWNEMAMGCVNEGILYQLWKLFEIVLYICSQGSAARDVENIHYRSDSFYWLHGKVYKSMLH